MVWNDITENALQFLDGMIAARRNGELPPLGLDLLLGLELPEKARNFRQNLNEGRVVFCFRRRVSLVARRASDGQDCS